MRITEQNIIGEIVAGNYKAASIFKNYKIDFCCKGDRSITQVCELKKIDKDILLEELNNISQELESQDEKYQDWPLDLLADYIEKTYHRYIRKTIPELKTYLNKVAKVHGNHNPELVEIEQLFLESAHDLEMHLMKEENILFPFIRQMVEAEEKGEKINRPHFNTVENPVAMMKHEHEAEGDRFRKIAKLSNNYTPPAHACNTYRVAFALINEFEENLHKHIHLENNILFPKSIQLQESNLFI